MKYLYAELIKVKHSKLIWICSGACWAICFFLYFQYTLNKSSGVFEQALTQPENSASFFVAMFAVLLSNFWATLVGSYIGSYEYSQSSITLHIVNSGRYLGTLWKSISLVIITVLNIFFGYCLGFLLSTIFFGINDINFSLGLAITQILNTSLIAICIGLLAMTISKLFKSFITSAILLVLMLFGAMLLPSSLSKIIYVFSPFAYISSNIEIIYSNVAHLGNFSLTNSDWMPYGVGVLFLIIWVIVLVTIQIVARKYEQF